MKFILKFLWTVHHEFYCLLRFIGLRDRLRCPHCKAVGTWKPHGGWLMRDIHPRPRRWMCKWCGFYIGPEPEHQAVMVASKPYWILKGEVKEDESYFTPWGIIFDFAHEKGFEAKNPWPWRG